MICEKVQEMISQFLDSELAPFHDQDLHAHLAGCETCRSFLRASMHLRASMLHSDQPPVPGTLDARMRAVGARHATAHITQRWSFRVWVSRRFLIPAPAAIASIVALMVSLAWCIILLISHGEDGYRVAANQQYMMSLPEVEVQAVFSATDKNVH